MPIGYIYWMLIILWVVFGLGYPWVVAEPNPHIARGSNVLLFVLLVLLGLQVFGSVVK
jgi:hypothetical protein